MEHPLLERDAPLARIAAAARAAQGGTGHTVLVTGEAGAGKTSLLRAFEAQASDVRVLHGGCEDLSIPEPLGPLHDLARAAGFELDALLRADRERLAMFGSALDRIETPNLTTVVVIEDLHWADEATLDFVRFAARRVHERRLLLVLTARDSEAEGRPQIRRALRGVPPADVIRIALQPLSPEAVATLAYGSGRSSAELHRITGGNPFYVTELLRGDAADGLAADGLATVQDAVLARCDRLDPQARALLDTVAIFPRRAERQWALDVAGTPEAAVDACMAAGLLEDTGEHLSFRHEIARQAVEAALGAAHRRRLNRAVLTRMEDDGSVPNARLLHHARDAGDRAAMARLAPLAGREALAAGANSQAAEYLALAIELTDPEDTETMAALLFDAGEACYLVARLRDALEYFERALALRQGHGDQRNTVRILQRLSRLHWLMGRKSRARDLGDRAIAQARGAETPELAMALAQRAQIAVTDFDIDCADLAREAIDLARRLRCWDVLSHALSTLSLTMVFDREAAQGQFDTSATRATIDESLSIATLHRQPLNITRAHGCAGIVWQYRLDFPAALHHFAQAIALGHEMDVTQTIVFDRGNRLISYDRLGRWDEAEAEALEMLAHPTGHSLPAIFARLAALRIAMRRGLPDNVMMLDEVVSLLGAEEDARHVCDVACLFAERAWLGLDPQAKAQEWLDRAMAMPGPPILKEELLYWQHRLDPTRPLGSYAGVQPPYLADLAGNWRAAAEEWARVGDPYRQALSLADGDAASLRQAMEILNRLGARGVADRLQARAMRAGVSVAGPPRPRAVARANPAGLTRRQMDVLRLLNEGRSNAEIGARLFISPKTVDHHVSAILAQLEVATRGEAAARARDAGWLTGDGHGERPR